VTAADVQFLWFYRGAVQIDDLPRMSVADRAVMDQFMHGMLSAGAGAT